MGAVRRHDVGKGIDDALIAEKLGVGGQIAHAKIILSHGGELYGIAQHGTHVGDIFVQGKRFGKFAVFDHFLPFLPLVFSEKFRRLVQMRNFQAKFSSHSRLI